jgi:hypothetical protein
LSRTSLEPPPGRSRQQPERDRLPPGSGGGSRSQPSRRGRRRLHA